MLLTMLGIFWNECKQILTKKKSCKENQKQGFFFLNSFEHIVVFFKIIIIKSKYLIKKQTTRTTEAQR